MEDLRTAETGNQSDEWGRHRETSCNIYMRTRTSIVFLLHIMCWLFVLPIIAFCEDETVVFTATPEQVNAGFAVSIDGMPGFIQHKGKVSPGDVLELEVGGTARSAKVGIVKAARESEETIVIPVLIEDKSLARGVTLRLITPEGNEAKVKIPPKRVFLSIPFSIPITGSIHPDFGGSKRHLMIQVVPKITKKAQVDIDNSSTEGLVADIKYEGLAYLKFKDILNRTNRRDLDGTFFFGRQEDFKWSLIVENLFEKFDKRTVGVTKNQRLSGDVKSKWRLDHINDLHSSRFGFNLVHDDNRFYANVGNIDRIVKGTTHVELGFGAQESRFITRYEGIEVVNPSGHSGFAMKVDRFGYQYRLEGGNERTYYKGRFGNLKVQDFNDEGEIDDYFNTDFLLVTQLGKNRKGWSGSKYIFSGEANIQVIGRGSNSWMEGGVDLNLGIGRDYLIFLRYNNDFMDITGEPTDPLWESFFVSFMRTRNYFDPKDPLARFDLDSIFIDLDYSREGDGAVYGRSVKIGLSKFMRIWKYDFPIELYIETVKSRVFRPGFGISIRRYL